MAAPLLKVENLEAGYDDVQVLWGVSLQVERGGVTTLVGANGAGKPPACVRSPAVSGRAPAALCSTART